MRREQVEEAYDYCRRVTQQASKTFYWGSMFLPSQKRRAIWAVYAFCRVVDDIVDEASHLDRSSPGHLHGSSSPEKALDCWRTSLERLYQHGGSCEGPIQLAWSDMLEHYAVPLKPSLDLLQGVAMDLSLMRYPTFDDLYLYCYQVAGTVGLLTSPIFGYHDETALAHAVDLGVALQLTNILRDIGEDSRRNRIYIPQEEMQYFGYCEQELMDGVINDAFRGLLRFQMARAEDYFEKRSPALLC